MIVIFIAHASTYFSKKQLRTKVVLSKTKDRLGAGFYFQRIDGSCTA
jgi:hypothetical protein